MKKRLESELISIAHRILKLKNKSEVDQLYKETQKLYETLSVLKFYQDNFESVKSDVTEDVLEEKLEQSLEAEEAPAPVVEVKEEIIEPIVEVEAAPEVVLEAEAAPEPETEEEVIVSEEPEATIEEEEVLTEEEPAVEEEPVAEEEEPVVVPEPSFKPIFELEVEEEEEIEPAETASEVKPEDKPVALEDFLGDYKDPVFVKPNEVSLFGTESTESEKVSEIKEEPKATTINEGHSKSIAIGLNDRIGFVQHLFNDSNEDFNRVISQLNTFDTFEEAKNFINEMVIPDYNYWVGEEDYIERFMEIVEKKFQ
ncbi:hypothetical protein [Flavobacterium sp. N1994]|uniref:hypothetical protein n=1 Tax=Flavobacterium sp. N1994 TaxID=2986827 RepID=UPI002222C663|nr:hypothetical protein [Flavobacterium sp. N1994]